MTIGAAWHELVRRVRAAVFAAAVAVEYCMSDEQWTEERSLSRRRRGVEGDAQSELRLAWSERKREIVISLRV